MSLLKKYLVALLVAASPASIFLFTNLSKESGEISSQTKWEFLYKLSNHTLSDIKKHSKHLKTQYLSDFEPGKPVKFLASEFDLENPTQYSEDWQGFKNICLKQISEDTQFNYYPQFSRLCYLDFNTSKETLENHSIVAPDMSDEALGIWEIVKSGCFNPELEPEIAPHCPALFEQRGSVSLLSRELFEHKNVDNGYLKNVPTNKQLLLDYIKTNQTPETFNSGIQKYGNK